MSSSISPSLMIGTSGSSVPAVRRLGEMNDLGRRIVAAELAVAARACGLERVNMAPSAITGATGNQEFFLHLRAHKVG